MTNSPTEVVALGASGVLGILAAVFYGLGWWMNRKERHGKR
jgi:hypothetical protein